MRRRMTPRATRAPKTAITVGRLLVSVVDAAEVVVATAASIAACMT